MPSFFFSAKFPVERLRPSTAKGDLSNIKTLSATEPPEGNRRFGALAAFKGNKEPVDEVLSIICCRCCGVSSG